MPLYRCDVVLPVAPVFFPLTSLVAFAQVLPDPLEEEKKQAIKTAAEVKLEAKLLSNLEKQHNQLLRLRPRSTKVARAVQEVQDFLDDESSVKVLMFTQWVSMIHEVGAALEEEGIGYCVYDGSLTTQERTAVVEEFQTEADRRVLICSLKAAA